MKNTNYSSNPIAFQSLSDKEKVHLLNSMMEEYKDSPKILKTLEELRNSIEDMKSKK